ncbi:hypothetical protein ADEAN_001055500 [Angomonas deanei]|uniref:Uncharacterized protein n=1 Tax=Angomonas deanei TaxID=59799 RepID=A0A7G2CT33_9TRYP|nr:hypothetical protein ADEAN_001055500 [Angomonas deanei]
MLDFQPEQRRGDHLFPLLELIDSLLSAPLPVPPEAEGNAWAKRPAEDTPEASQKPEEAKREPSQETQEPQPLSTKKEKRGFYTTSYFDIPLSGLGLEQLDPQKKGETTLRRSLLGKSCCFLLLGSSIVVSGNIVDINSRDSTAQICPDKGQDVALTWVEFDRLYKCPPNLEEVKSQVAQIIDNANQKE